MDFRVLGPLEVSSGGAQVRIGSRMQRRLLALLLVHAGEAVSADRVVDVLWAGEPPPSGSKGLHTYVSRLRRLLGDGHRLESDGHGYRLLLAEGELDARRFEQLVAAARDRLAHEPAQAAAGLAEALALWRGPAYGEFAGEDFARPEAVRLDELRLAATEDAFAARLDARDPDLVGDLEAFATAHALRERPHAQLMTALAHAGRQTEALEVFQRLRRRLADEVGLEPSPALQQLQADILRQGSSVALPEPDRDGRAVLEAPSRNLPQPVTSFVGRRHETEAVSRMLERGPLVTLTGVGGVGKSRLALHAAAEVADDYPDGVWWCELAPADPDAVDHTVAATLDLPQQANRSIAESIVAALADKRLLLVLDNCEHLLDASARLTEHLLRGCPDLTILATSREPLAVEGEQVWLVPPLPLPPQEQTDEHADATAIQLFAERAAGHRAGFTLSASSRPAVVEICRRLDGVPLAIELAAALVPALEPDEIADRLGHPFRLLTRGRRTDPRHRSLAAVVEWSYQLLDADEQRLFDRLAVFAGGFTLAAAEGVCADDDLGAERIAGVLAGLVSRSTVQVDRSVTPLRYHLLETLREYAGQRLAERGEAAAVRARHAAWFVDLAERADVAIRGPGEVEVVAELEAELANLRAAHRWAVDDGDVDLALRLVAALYVYARFRLRDEVFAWAEEAIELAGAAGHRLQPTVQGVAAHGISQRGELTRARELAEHALDTAPHVAAPGMFVPLRVLASVALYEGRLDDCHHYARESITAAKRAGDAFDRVWMQLHDVLPLVYGQQRDAALEAALAQRTAADALGNPNLRAWARYVHAEACGDDDPEAALGLLEDALALAEPVRGRYLAAVARVAMTSLRARHQSPREALTAFPDVIRRWHRVGDWTHQWTTLRNLVPLLADLGADEPAALLYGAQDAADATAPAYGDEAARLAEARAHLTERLGAEGFEALSEQGRACSGARVVELALVSIDDILARDGAATAGAQGGRPPTGRKVRPPGHRGGP